ncbi:MAG TPA: DUF3592 domain-containing protein [Longimicrobium sp.]|nr:DUF3592 domain-containing protein [Longimicrobium sp.]
MNTPDAEIRGAPILLAAAAVLLVLLFAGLMSERHTRAAQRWPAVAGQVTEAGTMYRSSTRRGRYWQVGAQYRYTVSGVTYTATTVNLQPVQDSAEAARMMERLRPGAAVTVYYNPDRPRDATLMR